MDNNFFLNYMKLSVLSNLKSDNIYLDIFIAFFFMVCINNLNISIIKEYIKKSFYKNKNYELSLFCEEVRNYRGSVLRGSDSFKGLLFHIKNKISANKVIGLKKIKEYYHQDIYCCDEVDDDTPLIFISNQYEKFQLVGNKEPDILFQIICTEQESSLDNKKLKVKLYELKLIGNEKNNLQVLQDYVEKKTFEYMHYMETHDDNLYVFHYKGLDSEKNTLFRRYPFYTTCDMSSLFFENKEAIIEKILFFKNNKDWYKNKSKPYTLGICTYGPPGCGKTSFEKALAKMLNRHIIIVDISRFNTKDEADNVFFSEKINDKIIPYDKRIYVFPDFDCQSKITNDRTLKEKDKKFADPNEENKEKDNVIIINNDKKILDELIGKKDKMNLSKLLNILDGIPERTGQIMIFNTNHPEHLDKALLRPGRMDMILNFNKITKQNLKAMIENHYNEVIRIPDEKIQDKVFTPAEIFKILSNYKNSEDAINDIANWKDIITTIE